MMVVNAMASTVSKHVEPLPEPVEDVKALTAEFEYTIPHMVPFFDFLFMQGDETELEEDELYPMNVETIEALYELPYTDVAVEWWVD